MRSAYKTLVVAKPEWKWSHSGPGVEGRIILKSVLKDTSFYDVDWIQVLVTAPHEHSNGPSDPIKGGVSWLAERLLAP
jgi:hypothetical protein